MTKKLTLAEKKAILTSRNYRYKGDVADKHCGNCTNGKGRMPTMCEDYNEVRIRVSTNCVCDCYSPFVEQIK